MSDGAVKVDDEGSPNEAVKRAGRARICKQCRFTTTDAREFSNHRLHAHAEENTEEKNQNRRNNSRRKSSAASVKTEEPTIKEDPPIKEEVSDLKSKSEIKQEMSDLKSKSDAKMESLDLQNGSEITEVKEVKNIPEDKQVKETEQTMADEPVPISNELLKSLALAPRKVADIVKSDKVESSNMDQVKRPAMEKIMLEKMNGHTEEVFLMNKDDDDDDEPRLLIADDLENGDENLDLSGDSAGLCRSGNIQNRTYLCNCCEFSTTNAKEYLHHQKDGHNSDITIFECDICDYATKYKQKLPRHRKLHFMGKEGYTESDLDSSLTEKELKEMKDISSINNDIVNGEEEMEEEAEMEEDEEEDSVLATPDTSIINTPNGATPVEKKKRIRQEVDPLKYYEVVDEAGVKYACSKCGNVYKWRKSLNKHWKEKHFGELPDLTKPPATLQNYTLFSRFKAKLGGQPAPPAAPNVVYGAAIPSPTSQVKQQNHRSTPTMKNDHEESPSPLSLSNIVMPRAIGPFIGSSSASVFSPAVSQSSLLKAQNHHELRQLMELHSKARAEQNRSTPKSSQLYQQSEPLDFSQPIDFSRKTDIKHEVMDTNSENDSLQEMEMPMSLVISQVRGSAKEEGATDHQENPVLQCNKCSFVAKTLVDYSAHMSLHLNKRAFKCAECQSHFNGVDDLNKHFLDAHSEKIQEHKEAIQKIPHGLQQTYHLLKMPLENISSYSSQELMNSEPKQLKCSMCQFVAKWPAELQKHAVSHSEERPFVCMVCGSTYKWKWDLVKHFEKSHSTLPNPYKRRDNGGVLPATSPSTPPPESISKTASALMDASMTGTAHYVLDGEIQPSRKRRLSETDLQDGDEYYRELLEKQIRKRREMANSETPSPVEGMWGHNRPSSEPTWSSSGELDSEEERMRLEERVLAGSTDLSTPRRDITEALKQRINAMRQGNEDDAKNKTPGKDGKGGADVVLPYKCTVCDYRARWPSEISQHMKNHSNEKPFHCPRCSYKSKWKWDVVKHLRRCGGGTVHDVIDTTKIKKMAPPNVMVMPQGNMMQHQQQQQHQQQVLAQPQKAFASQPVFPSSAISPSMASSNNSSSRLQTPNFIMSVGGQDHPDSLDLSQTSPNQQQGSGGPKQQPIFRGIVNQGMYHCMECPFVGNTQAELRRHSVLHSENKPFMCNMCGYSSRWKCDLKKHMKIYGHYSSALDISSDGDADTSQDKFVELDDESDEENKSTLYMCPQCPYNSYKKQAYDHHLRIHGNFMDDSSDAFPEKSSSSKFKCSKCDYHGNDLSSFLQHKRSHQDDVSPKQNSKGMSRDSPVLDPSKVSNRTLHLKQRRKPVKQFGCKKCPYVCFRRIALTTHELMHSTRGTDAYLCMFCDYSVFSKSLLLQHMRLHPEYNPAECSELDLRVSATELMEMEELEEKEINNEEMNGSSMMEENNNIGDYESGFDGRDEDSSQKSVSPFARMSTPIEDKKPVTNNNTTPTNNNINNNNNAKGSGLPCEWCSATFPNVVTLYHHAQALHSLQLRAQEAGDIAASQAPPKSSQLEQIVRERQKEYQVYHQFMAQQQIQLQSHIQAQPQNSTKRYVPLAPKPFQSILPQVSPSRTSTSTNPSNNNKQVKGLDQLGQSHMNPNMVAALKARKSVSQQKRARSFQCTKCSFTAPNAVTYLRHIERHGSNCKHTCLYCDYSIDRLNLLYQHMKGTHGSKWQGTTAEKINLSVHVEDTNNNIIENLTVAEENSNSSHYDSMESDIDLKPPGDEGALSFYMAKGIKPVLVIQEETSWCGTKLQICTLNGHKHYKCPKCLYISSNAANCSIHVRHHGQNRKYMCTQCDYGVDNIMHLQSHFENIHPKEPSVILKMPTEQSRVIEDDQEDSTEMTIAEIEAIKRAEDTKQASIMSCPKCPFKTSENEKYQIHLNRHRIKGKYECQLCDYSSDKYKYLRQHADLHTSNHGTNTPATEMDDDRSIDEQGAIDSEMDENSNDKLRYRCSCCLYITLVRQDILKHRLCHILKKNLDCKLCTYSTDHADNLAAHMRLHQGSPVRPAKGFHDVTVDPYNDSYKLIEQIPDDDEEEEMDVEQTGNAEENAREFEGGDEFEDTGDADVEDDIEMALMEEELRDSIALTGESKPKTVSRNLNEEGAFDSDIQFRNFKCQDCPYSSNSNAEYRKHSRLHGSCLKFKCEFCNYSLDRINLISQHRKLHFQEPGFEVSPLMAKLLNKDHEEYEIMLQKVGKELAYPPNESSKVTEDSIDYSYLMQRGLEGMEEKTRYSCNKCPYKCQALKSFRCHIQLHGLMRKYKCDYCDWSADRLNLLYQHRKVHTTETGFNPAPGDIVFLNREFILDNESAGGGTVGMAMMEFSENSFSWDLSQTLQTAKTSKTPSGQKVISCKICPFKTDSVNTYSYHKKLHFLQARYKCSECTYSINNITSLKEHIKLHKKEREMIQSSISESTGSYKCPKCPYASPNKNLLVGHTSMHSAGRKYECSQCDFSADKQQLIDFHQKVHDDDYDSNSQEEMEMLMKKRPDIIGPQLYFSSPNMQEIDSDSNSSNDQEQKCDKCPFSTPSKDELGDHLQHHTTPSKISCMYCTYSCTADEELLKHVQVHFPSTTVDKELLKVLKTQNLNYRKNFQKSDGEDEKADGAPVEDHKEPDSTVNEAVKEDSVEKEDQKKDSGKTKVYVCQYCEREFDCKTSMLQHEKQHLVGSQF